jgi:hypothetical protein
LEELIEQAGMQVLNSGQLDCLFEYPNYEVFWQANVSAGPVQGALHSVDEEKLKAAVNHFRPVMAAYI